MRAWLLGGVRWLRGCMVAGHAWLRSCVRIPFEARRRQNIVICMTLSRLTAQPWHRLVTAHTWHNRGTAMAHQWLSRGTAMIQPYGTALNSTDMAHQWLIDNNGSGSEQADKNLFRRYCHKNKLFLDCIGLKREREI